MPELEFKEEEPLKTVGVTPTMAKQAQIELAAQDSELTGSEEPRVRFAEWTGQVAPPTWGKIPLWLCAVLTGLVWLSIAKLLSVPASVYQPGTHLREIGFPPSFVASIGMAGVMCLVLISLVVTMLVDRARFRRRLPKLRKIGQSPLDQALRQEDGLHGQIGVTVVLGQNGIIYGEDAGYLHFEGTSLYFEGLRTSFSISKSRLTSRPPQVGVGRFFRSGFPTYFPIRLEYREGGTDFQLGIRLLEFDPQVDQQRGLKDFKTWMEVVGEPAEFEMLPPRKVPLSAKREAIQSLALPFLALQGLCYLACTALNSYLLSARLDSRMHLPSSFGYFDNMLTGFIAIEVLLIGYPAVVVPLIRGIRRYRFVKRNGG